MSEKNVSFSSMYVRACVHLSSSCHSSNSTVGPLKVSMCLWKWKPRMHSQQQVLGESWNIQQDHRCPVSVFTEIQCTSYFQKRLYMQTVQMTLYLRKFVHLAQIRICFCCNQCFLSHKALLSHQALRVWPADDDEKLEEQEGQRLLLGLQSLRCFLHTLQQLQTQHLQDVIR